MLHPYTGSAQETYKRITGDMQSYIPNRLYKATEGPLFYINSKGYIHTYKASKTKFNGRTAYILTDYILTKENTLKESNYETYADKDRFVEVCKDMETAAIQNYLNVSLA